MPKVWVSYLIEETVEVDVTDEQLAAMRDDEPGAVDAFGFCLKQADAARVNGECPGQYSDVNRSWVSTDILHGEEELYSI